VITVILADYRAAVIISNRWFAVAEAAWRALFAFADRYAVSMLALIHLRLCDVREAAARTAALREQDLCVVTWEMRAALQRGPEQSEHKATTRNQSGETNVAPTGRESLST
jgi:hypothetical protein